MWPPPFTLIVPSWFTVFGWHWLHVAGVTMPVSVGCPVGGRSWQAPQPTTPPFQVTEAAFPLTPL
jgi:hypothetical protein